MYFKYSQGYLLVNFGKVTEKLLLPSDLIIMKSTKLLIYIFAYQLISYGENEINYDTVEVSHLFSLIIVG